MRMKLGLAVAAMTAASVLAFGAPGAASPSDDAPVATDETTTTTVAPTSTTTTVAPTTSTTTTTLPPIVDGPIEINTDRLDTRNGELVPINRGTAVVINPPPTSTTTTLPPGPDYSLPANSGTGFRAVYSKSLQKVWVVNSAGAVIKEHRVSGKMLWCDPRVGTYSVFSKSRWTFAIQNPTLIWGYMVRFTKGCNGGNIGFHEIPWDKYTDRRVQSISQLGTPLSGGCVRQAPSDAKWMYDNIAVGTKVVVLP